MSKIERFLLAVGAGAALLVAASMIGGRYELGTALNGAVIRLDKITGDILVCDGERCWDARSGPPL